MRFELTALVLVLRTGWATTVSGEGLLSPHPQLLLSRVLTILRIKVLMGALQCRVIAREKPVLRISFGVVPIIVIRLLPVIVSVSAANVEFFRRVDPRAGLVASPTIPPILWPRILRLLLLRPLIRLITLVILITPLFGVLAALEVVVGCALAPSIERTTISLAPLLIHHMMQVLLMVEVALIGLIIRVRHISPPVMVLAQILLSCPKIV